jgi:hypothetical protein
MSLAFISFTFSEKAGLVEHILGLRDGGSISFFAPPVSWIGSMTFWMAAADAFRLTLLAKVDETAKFSGASRADSRLKEA